MERREWLVMSVVCAFLLWLLILAGMGMIREQRTWEQFSLAHNCRVIGRISGSSTVAFGLSANGQMTSTPVFIPGKVGYACDDGQQYWRDE